MIKLRPYQEDAVCALFDYFDSNHGHPIVSIPTGGGKTLVIAEFIRRTIELWPAERFLVLSHVKELLEQNASKLAQMAPHLSVSLYSAGLGRKRVGRHVTVAGIQSVYKGAAKLGDISIVIVDEAHLVGKNTEGMYRRFLTDLRAICPRVRLVGLSATPFRLDSGSLIKGENRIFTDIAYSTTILDLIVGGFLAPLTTAPTRFRVNTSSVAKRGGEFVTGDLANFMDRDEITRAALDQAIPLCADRRAWIVFCVGVEHAEHVCAELVARDIVARVVTGDTPKAERAASLAAFKRGEIRALVSVGVLTTGFDAPNADALICLRPTMSPGLWVQMVGRITRPSPGKANGLVLDFTTNTRTHGPIDTIDVTDEGEVRTAADDTDTKTGVLFCPVCDDDTRVRKGRCAECGHAHTRVCPECSQVSMIIVRECATCGFVWPDPAREPKHDTVPTGAPILSNAPNGIITEDVDGWTWSTHRKPGKPDSVCVTYVSGIVRLPYREWLCFEHGGYAASKSRIWWRDHGGGDPPKTTSEALGRQSELTAPRAVSARRDGKYWQIVGRAM